MANTIKLGNGNWATKEGSLLAYNDENNNFKPLPFTTTRASSATVVNKQGLIETVGSGIPRIDFSDDANGALLLEPQRSNLVPRSEDIDTGWSKLNVTVANNQTVSPDGTLSASLCTANSSNGQHASYDTLSSSVISGQPYYISCFVKKSNTRYIRLNEGYTGDQLYYDFDNNIATLGGGASDEIVEDFGNGWFRIGFKFLPTTVNTQFALYLNDNSNNNSYAGSGEEVYIYGAQVEQGSYATSYIKTVGTTQTRVADTASGSGSSTVINSSEGTLYAEISALSDDGTDRYLSLSDGSFTNRVSMYYSSSTGIIGARIVVGGASVFLNAPSQIQTNNNKIAIKWKLNDYKIYINGVQVASNVTGGTFPSSTLSELSFNDGGTGVAYMNANVKSVQIYTTALSDSELISLTTI